jgi:hypothetical protein
MSYRMSAASHEISTLTLPDVAVDAAIAPHNYTGNVSRMCSGLMRAQSEGQLRLVVLGTSMAGGAGLAGKERSWPKWLEDDVVKYSGGAFRNATVSFATGGMSASFAPKLHTMRKALHAAHVVIADYSLNDRPTHCLYVNNKKGRELEAAMGGQFMDALLHVLRPSTGALFLELFPIGGLVNKITSEAQRAAFADAPGAFLAWERPNETCVHRPNGGREPSDEERFERASQRTPRCPYDVARNFHWPELVARSIPVLSYADGACRSDASPAVLARALWDGEGRRFGYPHPSEATHRVATWAPGGSRAAAETAAGVWRRREESLDLECGDTGCDGPYRHKGFRSLKSASFDKCCVRLLCQTALYTDTCSREVSLGVPDSRFCILPETD